MYLTAKINNSYLFFLQLGTVKCDANCRKKQMISDLPHHRPRLRGCSWMPAVGNICAFLTTRVRVMVRFRFYMRFKRTSEHLLLYRLLSVGFTQTAMGLKMRH